MVTVARMTRSAPLSNAGIGLQKGQSKARPNADVGQVIDQVVALIIERAVEGLNDAVEYTADRARHHAPVRSVFNDKGDSTNKAGKTTVTSQHSRGGVRTQFPRGPGYIRSEGQMDLFRASKIRTRRLNAGGYQRDGGANTFQPVLRFQKSLAAAETPERDNPRDVLAGPIQSAGGRTLAPIALLRTGSKKTVTLAADQFLSARGRYELKTGRASAINAIGGIQVGGTLRNSIRTILATVSNRPSVWGYVVTDVPYAKHQEFGTVHNRAHPFLRPALYEARGILGRFVRRSIARTSSRYTVGSGLGRTVDDVQGDAGSLGVTEYVSSVGGYQD